MFKIFAFPTLLSLKAPHCADLHWREPQADRGFHFGSTGARSKKTGEIEVMRTLVAVAVACSSLVSLGQAQSSAASIRKDVNIEAQDLSAALKEFAREREQYLIFDDRDVVNHRTMGATGTMTQEETLGTLLKDTGLTYLYLDERTVTIVPVASRPAIQNKDDTASAVKEAQNPRGFWGRFRVAQAVTGTSGVNGANANANANAESMKLEEVVVTAQKREERLKDVPMSISVLSGETLDEIAVAGISEALNRVPGVVTSTAVQGGGTQIAIRGVGASGPVFSGSSPIAYYLDTVPFGLVKSAVAPDSNAYDLERVEVLRGPQGTLYGATAQNGVVRVLTKEADLDQFDFKARAGGSSTDNGGSNYRADAAINVPLIDGKLAVRGVVGAEDLSGWIDSPVGTDINDAQLRNYRLKINAQPTQALSIGFSTWLSRNTYGAPSSASDEGTIISRTNQEIKTDYDAHGLKIDYDWSGVSLTSTTSYLSFEQAGDLGAEALGLSPLFTALDSDIFAQEVILQSAQKAPWSWSIGGFYRDGEDRLRQRAIWFAAPVDFADFSESYAIFGQLSQRFAADRFQWTLGLRYFSDDVRNLDNLPTPDEPPYQQSDSFSAVSPRAVLTWFPNQDTTVYVSYAEGFRSGFPQNENVRFFPALKPDELHNYEIGLKAEVLDRRLSFEAAVYYMDWSDVQQTISSEDADGNCCFSALVNGESASGVGIDLGFTARPVHRLELGLNVSWNDLQLDSDVSSGGFPLFSEGDRLNFSSEYTANAFIDYDFMLGGTGWTGSISTSANFISKQYARGLFGVPFVNEGDDLLISRAGFTVTSPTRWTATLFVENLNDERGGMPASLPIADWSARQRPRTVGLQFEYRL
jgi:iron complex outermembrane recepter protein